MPAASQERQEAPSPGGIILISRIDHVSIAVRDQKKAEHFFRDILGAVACVGSMGSPQMRYFWQLYSLGDLSRLEIISPTGKGSYLDGFLKNREEGGVHHITLQTPDLHRTMKDLKEKGIPFFGHNEYAGAVWKEIFIHPRHAFGVLIQIAEFYPAEWLSEKVKLPDERKWQVEKTDTGTTLICAHPGGGKVRLELDRVELKQLLEELEKTVKEA